MTAPCVYGATLQLVQSSTVARAVTQEVYVGVWRSAARYDPSEGSVLAWMLSMAHRQSASRTGASDRSAAEG